jgi:tetratricopeptide (TPR) repeat protein
MTGNLFTSFGALLQTIRRRQRLTQQQLAEAIGVHRRTLVRWEQGDYLPESKALVLELARHLKLDDQETRQLLEASLTALAPHWSVPLPRNPYFTGREEILEALHAQLGVDQAVALTQSSALHGLGGVGKTQIALEYAHRYALDYRAVFWIGAETEEQIVSSLLRVASVLQLSERDDKDQQRVITAVQQWFSTHSQWLLIWDNLEDLTLLDRFLPSTRSGVMLLTTRCQALGTLAWGIDLLPMEQEEGMLFLLRRAKMLEPEATCEDVRHLAESRPTEYAVAWELVTVLGGLPLALDQAGSYLEATRCGLSAYLELFRTRRAVLLKLRGEGARDHPASVSTTFTLALTATTQHHPAVGDLLRVCALLQPDAIPEELFRQGAEHLGATLQVVCCDRLEWDQVVGVACSYSLLSRQPEEQTLSIHRLVQAVLLDSMTEEEREVWTRRVMDVLNSVFPDILPPTGTLPPTTYTTWKQGERLLPHALLSLHRAAAQEASLPLASLASKAAQYLHERGRYAQAELLYQRALRIREQVLGPEHPEVAASLNSLANLSWEQGQYPGAERLLQRALQIREQALGPEHPEVAASLNNVAILAFEQGQYAQAEPLYQRALQIWEQALGETHPYVAYPLNNLAELYCGQGKYAQAEPLAWHALQIWEQALGETHPYVADALQTLANLFRDQDQYAQAEPLYQRALQIREQAVGLQHPKGALLLTDLAECYRLQGQYAQAEPLYQRALQIWEQTLGPEYPSVAAPLNGLANLWRDGSHYPEAERLYQRARSLRERRLGPQHPDTAQTLHDLAIFRHEQGNLGEAFSLAERALQIRSQSFGDAHPKTVATQTLYTQLVQEQERAAKGGAHSAQQGEELADGSREGSVLERAVITAPSEHDPLQEFLDACCELHPLVWCRISELWHTYIQWTASAQQRVPLSRRAFAAQLKARGCQVDRTNTTRIWRGIHLVKTRP